MNHSKTAAVLSLLPGGGQFYNKQWLKGLLYLIATVSFAFAFGDLLNIGLWGIVTLGEQIPRDNSVFLLAEGILAIIILFFGVTLYWLNIRDAYKNGERRDRQLPVTSLRESYLNLPAQVPGKPWLDQVKTQKVKKLSYVSADGENKITWNDTNSDSKFYTVYRQEGNLDTVDIKNPENLIARFGIMAGTEYIDTDIESGKVYTYAVTVVDNASVESKERLFNIDDMEN